MLTRIYIDNFRSLVNFEFSPEREQLLLGRNGSGKSACFDALARINRLTRGEGTVGDLFPFQTLTRWQSQSVQTFELHFKAAEGIYRYRLQVKHDREKEINRIEEETLHLADAILFTCKAGEARLFRDNGSAGPTVLSDWARSSLPALHERADNKKLTALKRLLSGVVVARPDPRAMVPRSEKEQSVLNLDFSNFASWFRHLWQENSEHMLKMLDHLKASLDGFQSMSLISEGSQRVLRTQWRAAAGTIDYGFDELSDGQRIIIALATLVFSMGVHASTLCLDEPDNFVALREIQPLLWLLRDRPNLQIFIISHHPELIDDLARSHGVIFERVSDGPTRLRRFNAPDDTLLTPSQVVARGEE